MMTQQQALEILRTHRKNQVVVTTMGSAGIWPKISDSLLDFAYLPSSMGQGISLGMGIALAKKRDVIVVSGDGSFLMNLGALVTVANTPAPLWIIVIDNGLYGITGGQSLSGAGKTDYAALAASVGLTRVYSFSEATPWKEAIPEVLAQPAFVWLRVEPEYGQKTPAPPRPMQEQIARLRQGLGE